MELKILSWNIWCDGDFAKITEFLRASNADIIGLQEVVPKDATRDVISFLSGLGYECAIAQNGAVLTDGRMITVALFSKYPIQRSEAHPLSVGSPREAIETDIRVNSTILRVFSLHFKHTHQKNENIQEEQVESLIKVLPKEHVIVMGDFNATAKMASIKRAREVLTDTDTKELPTLNAPLFDCKICDASLLPTTKLDYIFVSRDLRAHSFKVEGGMGSDHFPVSTILEL